MQIQRERKQIRGYLGMGGKKMGTEYLTGCFQRGNEKVLILERGG